MNTNKQIITHNFEYENSTPVFNYNSYGFDKQNDELGSVSKIIYFSSKALSIRSMCRKKVETSLNGSKLFFTKGTVFQRAKLNNTKYTRKLKMEDADCVIIPNVDTLYGNGHVMIRKVFKKENLYVTFPAREPYEHIHAVLKDLFSEEFVDCGVNYCYFFNKDSPEALLLDAYHGKFNKPIVEVSTLETLIGTPLTESDADSIREMLLSTDDNTRKLGIKLLTNYNYMKYPCLSRCLLLENRKILKEDLKENSVAINSLKKNLLSHTKYNPEWVKNIYQKDIPSDFEKSYIRKVTLPYYKKFIQRYINVLTNVFPDFPTKVTMELEYE